MASENLRKKICIYSVWDLFWYSIPLRGREENCWVCLHVLSREECWRLSCYLCTDHLGQGLTNYGCRPNQPTTPFCMARDQNTCCTICLSSWGVTKTIYSISIALHSHFADASVVEVSACAQPSPLLLFFYLMHFGRVFSAICIIFSELKQQF